MTDDVHLTDRDSRALITVGATAGGRDGLAETLFVEAGAGSGKTKSLVDRVVALVERGVPLSAIAAITFTEKAATELRDRIRRVLEQRRDDPELDEAARARAADALDEIDVAAISTLHAFAQRILTEHAIEAELPPNVDVMDEVASEIAFEERWRTFRDALLDDPAMARTILLGDAVGVRLDDIRQLAVEFDANWDLATDPDRVPWGTDEPAQLDVESWIADAEALLAVAEEACTDTSDKLYVNLQTLPDAIAQLRGATDEFLQLGVLRKQKGVVDLRGGAGAKWDGGKPQVDELKDTVKQLRADSQALCSQLGERVLHRLAVAVSAFVADAAEQRRAAGELEFHDLLVMARELLRGPRGWTVRQALRQRYQRLLLDEFQDTDPIQIELAVLIASPDPDAGERPWDEIEVDPGRLFFVGDPKQSIYRFRRADIDLFLRAREVFSEDAPVELTTNFRTTPPIIRWVNHVFDQLIEHHPGSQPGYVGLDPSPWRTPPPVGPAVAVLGAEMDEAAGSADELRHHEAEAVADTVARAIAEGWQVLDRPTDDQGAWRDCTLGDITILLPARTSLPMLERALDARGIAYRAESSSLVYATAEVRDVFAAVRAVADPTDELSLVTALRSPVFGCGDDDLVTWKREHRGSWNLRAPRDEQPADHPVAVAMDTLRDLHDRAAWATPSELLDALCRERRLFELGYAQGRPRDLWRRLRFVIDQARAWHEAEGGTLRQYLDWARLQASESARVAETILPESDDDSVRIMTVHASKGLEFPVTILSGTTTATRSGGRGVQVSWPKQGPVALKANADVTTEQYELFQPIDEQMSHHERLRLLYVAATRAQDHLVVSMFRKPRKGEPSSDAARTNAELFAEASEGAPHQQLLGPLGAATPSEQVPADDRPELIDLATWGRERERALATSARRRSVGASDVQRLLEEHLDAGDDKDPLDLDLPAWRKGRYGTSIGRAVHGVLQTIDLATGEGLDEAVAAQTAAEGIVGLEDDVRSLVGAALGSPTVVRAATRPRWRETYVATQLGDTTLEGYLDLLYRDDDGLVVVDYKTASSSHDLDRRMAHYRSQGGAYALAVREATAEAVARVVFVFLTPDGAIERTLDDLDGAVVEVGDALRVPAPA